MAVTACPYTGLSAFVDEYAFKFWVTVCLDQKLTLSIIVNQFVWKTETSFPQSNNPLTLALLRCLLSVHHAESMKNEGCAGKGHLCAWALFLISASHPWGGSRRTRLLLREFLKREHPWRAWPRKGNVLRTSSLRASLEQAGGLCSHQWIRALESV